MVRFISGRHNVLRRGFCITTNNDDAVVTDCAGWQSVQQYAELTVDGKKLVLCRYPFRTWRDIGKTSINLHGHSHGRLKPLPRQFDVGVDVWDFRPVRLDEILTLPSVRRVAGSDQRSKN